MSLKKILNLNVKDIPHVLKVLFPKVRKYGKKERKESERKIVSLYGMKDGVVSLASGRYLTTEDIRKKKEKLGLPYSFS